MSLAPKFAAHRLSADPAAKSVHTIELFLDYVCPFSKKMFKTVYHDVFPVVMERYPDKVHFIFRQQIQPWHPSSTLVHEAGLAVARLAPERFYPFSDALFEKQTDYFDVEVVNEPRNRTYERLAKLGAGVGVDEKKLLELLRVDGKPAPDGGLNIGNKVTDDLKLLVKANRLVGVHVTPTVIFNGIVDPSIQSSFTKQQWTEWLEKNVT